MIFIIGGLNLDIIVESSKQLLYLPPILKGSLKEKFRGKEASASIDLFFGGQGGNIALFSSFLGEKACLYSIIGDDLFSKIYIKRLKDFKVIPKVKTIKDEKIGKVLIIKDSNNYKMVRDKEISRYLNEKFLENALKNILKEVKLQSEKSSNVLIIVSYALISKGNLEVLKRFLKPLKELKVVTVIDTSSVEALKIIGKDNFLNYLKKDKTNIGIDFIFPNLEEAKFLTGLEKKEEMVEALSNYFDNIILKTGKNGIFAKLNNNKYSVKAKKVSVVDETGAGDGVIASFFHKFLKNKNIEDSLEFSNHFASEIISYKGAQGIIENLKKL